jgi:Immunoglobulin-like domain of bacterial spore germination
MLKIIYGLVVVAVLAGVASFFISKSEPVATIPGVPEDQVMCTMDAKQCPDGSYVGRTGPKCEFVCPEASLEATSSKTPLGMIRVSSPTANEIVTSPFTVTGEARGSWFFEGSFPIELRYLIPEGYVFAEAVARADGDWMTEDFVPFTAVINFQNPRILNEMDLVHGIYLILKKSNPSGLPENDDSVQIPLGIDD